VSRRSRWGRWPTWPGEVRLKSYKKWHLGARETHGGSDDDADDFRKQIFRLFMGDEYC